MKFKTILAIILISGGAIALIYEGISWTTREKAVDLGPIQISTERSHSLPLSPLLGGVALGIGIVMFLTGRKAA